MKQKLLFFGSKLKLTYSFHDHTVQYLKTHSSKSEDEIKYSHQVDVK
jgi:hypothetical protein